MIEKVLTLSTDHLPTIGPEWHTGQPDSGPTVMQYTNGYLLFVPKGDVPDWLRPIVELATTEGCAFICFDSDADEIGGLEVYD